VETVVETAKDVVTMVGVPLRAGQFVTVGAQLVMVTSCVDQIVRVDGATGADDTGETSEEAGTDVGGMDAAGVTVDGQAVIMAGFEGTNGAQMPIK